MFEDTHLDDASTEAILHRFVKFVTKTDEEIAEEGRKNKKKSTELKIYVAANNGFSPENLSEHIQNVVSSDDINNNPKGFFENHTFSVKSVNEEASHLSITSPRYDRSDDFLLINDEDYLKVITVIRRSIAKSTIEKLIQYLPLLDRIFLSSNDLRELVDQYDKRDLSGFTAKYEPFFKDEYISVQVHGGSDKHLDKVQEEFDARAKRVVFSQRNSPAEAVKGTVSQDGYASIPRVRAGSGDVGVETIENLIEATESKDRENFEVEHKPERLTPGDHHFLTQLTIDEASDDSETDGGVPEPLRDADQGSVLDGMTLCVFEEEVHSDEYPDDDAVAEILKDDILDHKQRYRFASIGENHFIVYDADRGQSFEIAISNKNLKVYSRNNTTREGLRDFYQIIDGEFNSSYNINKFSKKVRA